MAINIQKWLIDIEQDKRFKYSGQSLLMQLFIITEYKHYYTRSYLLKQRSQIICLFRMLYAWHTMQKTIATVFCNLCHRHNADRDLLHNVSIFIHKSNGSKTVGTCEKRESEDYNTDDRKNYRQTEWNTKILTRKTMYKQLVEQRSVMFETFNHKFDSFTGRGKHFFRT